MTFVTRVRNCCLGLLVVAVLDMSFPATVSAAAANLPVPTITLYPGDTITPELIIYRPFTGSEQSFAPFARYANQLAQKSARRTLVAGRPIPLVAVKNPDAVHQGVAATAVYEANGLKIITMLLPLRNAAVGETIEARNIETGTVVRAVVKADGSLRLGTP